MTKEEFVAKAYRDYPVGTKFISPDDGNKVREVKPYGNEKEVTWSYNDNPRGYRAKNFVVRTDSGLCNKSGGCSNPAICIDGVWATIVESKITYNYLIL